jgi:uncharacterized damage-inducible protein DinB
MTDIAVEFVDKSRRLLTSDYLPKIERCVSSLNGDDIWWRPNEASNSIGNLILHLCGNITQWIVGGVAQLPFERHRQQEFDERRPIPGDELIRRLKAAVARADELIAGLDRDRLLDRRSIQRHDNITVLEAIYHVVEHFSMHTGQIITLTKMRAASDLRLWQPRP